MTRRSLARSSADTAPANAAHDCRLRRDQSNNVFVTSAVTAHAAFVVGLQKPFGVQVATPVQLIQALQLCPGVNGKTDVGSPATSAKKPGSQTAPCLVAYHKGEASRKSPLIFRIVEADSEWGKASS